MDKNISNFGIEVINIKKIHNLRTTIKEWCPPSHSLC